MRDGCWYCGGTDDLTFSWEWDTYVHIDCVRRALQENPDDGEAKIFADELGITPDMI